MTRKKRILLTISVLAVASIAFLVWYYQPSPIIYSTVGWIALIAILLWQGNRQLTTRLDKWLPWNKAGNFRFFIHLLLGLIYLLVLINISYVVVKVITGSPPTEEQFVVTNFWGAVLFIPVFSIYFSLHFLKHWRKSELETERVQKENMRTQLNSLKTQLDPHFLFNNLNILSSLVETDAVRSKKFIDHFAEVYRALLQSNKDDLILLSDELDFIESYMYLIKTRFDKHILFTIDINPSAKEKVLPPLTLQLLIENAIKHNDITQENPLSIQLLQLDDDYLLISNSLREKKIQDDRQGSGLLNIQNRYAYFTDKPVKIKKTDSHFEVHIPLLEIETV